MADRPIIFSAPMIRALLAGHKTQTRRVLKPQPKADGKYYDIKSAKRALRFVPGDRLWVKESWCDISTHLDAPAFAGRTNPIAYRADNTFIGCHQWKSPLFMPRKVSRLTLIVEAEKVERLEDVYADKFSEVMRLLDAKARKVAQP